MSSNESVIRRLFEQGFTGGDNAVIEDAFAPDAGYSQPGVPGGMEGLKLIVQLNNEAFADWRFEIEDLISTGDKVVLRWTARGVHENTFLGEGPTGRDIALTGISIYQLEGDRVIAAWSSPDTLGLLHQLEVVPKLQLID